jgi:hypothetical protein
VPDRHDRILPRFLNGIDLIRPRAETMTIPAHSPHRIPPVTGTSGG